MPKISSFRRGLPLCVSCVPGQHHTLQPGAEEMISGPVDFVLPLLLLFSHSPFSQGTTPWLDYKNFHVTRFSLMKQISDIVESAMNPTCASNVMEFLCHTWFKECTPFVGKSTGNQLWLPSPLCRSECERHWNVWNECVGALETDEQTKTLQINLTRKCNLW